MCIQKVFPTLSKSFVLRLFISHPPPQFLETSHVVIVCIVWLFFSRIDLFHPSVIVNFHAGESKDLTKAIYMIKIYPGSEFEYEGREGAVIKAGHTCPSWESSEMTHAQGPVFFCPPQWTLSHGINMTTFRVSLPPRLILFGNKPDILTFITYLVGPYVC